MIIDRILRGGLLQLEPERSHHAALALLQLAQSTPGGVDGLRALYAPSSSSPVELCGLRFPNRVGLAAGYDKNAVAWQALAALGFGHVEVGTVTPRPQCGNPKPRVFRMRVDRCLINRLGFPSDGAEVVKGRLRGLHRGAVVLGVNLGKNKDTPLERAVEDYVSGVKSFAKLADYLTVNVSSPNTPGLRSLQTGDALRELIAEVLLARDEHAGGKVLPVFVKLSPDLDEAQLDDALDAIVGAGADGVIATNTTLARDGMESSLRAETGGMSGALLTERGLQVTRMIREKLPKVPLIGVGGVMTAEDAKARIDAGADLVQVYTGLVFGGAGVVRQMVDGI